MTGVENVLASLQQSALRLWKMRVHPVYSMGAGLLPVASHRPLGVLRPALCASGDASLEMGMTRKVFQPSQPFLTFTLTVL